MDSSNAYPTTYKSSHDTKFSNDIDALNHEKKCNKYFHQSFCSRFF